MSKNIYILGTHLSHDGSACLLKDGKIVAAIEKERITRRKHDGGNDTAAIQYCLDAAGISIYDLDLVVQNANFEKETLSISSYQGKRVFPTDYNVPVVTISHHLAHAYSAIGTSPFDECNVMVIDGAGSPIDQCDDLDGPIVPDYDTIINSVQNFWCEKDSFYRFDGKLTPLYKEFSPFNHTIPQKTVNMPTIVHSIGGVYQAVSQYCFGNVDDTGKLMGLSPYGKKGAINIPVFELRDGTIYNTLDWRNYLNQPFTTYENFKANFQYYADIARWIQDETERAVLYLFNERQKKYPHNNWCYAGGVALNAVVNQRILAETGIKNLYIQPAAGDNGIAIGCAYYGWMEVFKKERVQHNGKSSFGAIHPITNIVADNTITIEHRNDWIKEAARLLSEGAVIAWFYAGSEFGPRALGHRSILADPRKPGVKDFINREIKLREDFRPFAPAVPREDCTRYFKYNWDSPYMVLVNPVKDEWKEQISNAVHLNGTSRVQTVTPDINPAFYNLLREFEVHSGISVLLNTSLNRRGMPIIETPEQAIEFFKEAPLDYLVFENYIISKQNEHQPVANV